MRGKPSPRSCYVVMAGRDPPSSRIIRYPFERGLRRPPRNAPAYFFVDFFLDAEFGFFDFFFESVFPEFFCVSAFFAFSIFSVIVR